MHRMNASVLKIQKLIWLLYYLIFTTSGSKVTANSNFLLSACTCVGSSIMFECTAVGTGATIWKGSAFSCPISLNEIRLFHSQFQDGRAMGTCNNGQIIGYVSAVPEGLHFRSRLDVQVTSADMNSTTVECEYDDGAIVHSLQRSNIILTTEPLPPPVNIRVNNVSSGLLEFAWDPVAVACPAVHYKIESINCGRCPNTTSLTNATCTDLEIFDKQTCTFEISTIVCSDIVGTKNSIQVQLQVPDISSSKIDVIPTYDNHTGHLMMLSTHITEPLQRDTVFNVSHVIGGATSYIINYADSDTGKSCGNANISATSCTTGACSHNFVLSQSACSQANLSITVFVTNVLGNGKSSTPIKREYLNGFVEIEAMPESNRLNVICKFLSESDSFKSCQITYFDQNCQKPISNESENATGVSVSLSLDSLPVHYSTYCFISTANNGTLKVNVNGTYEVMADNNMTPSSTLEIVLVTVLIISMSVIIIIVTIIIYFVYKKAANVASNNIVFYYR